MKAVIIQAVGRPTLKEIPEQAMRPDYIKVKTVAVAINPSKSPKSFNFWCRN